MAGPIWPGTSSRPSLPRTGALSPKQVSEAIVTFGRKFWAAAEAEWRLKLAEARHEVVKGGFSTLAAAGQPVLPADLAIRIADRFSAYREEQMFVFPGAHEAIDALEGARRETGAGDQRAPPGCNAPRSSASRWRIASTTSRSRASMVSASPTSAPTRHAMPGAGRHRGETWMVGDNLEWEVVTPQRSASMRSGSTPTARACLSIPPSSPTASSAR